MPWLPRFLCRPSGSKALSWQRLRSPCAGFQAQTQRIPTYEFDWPQLSHVKVWDRPDRLPFFNLLGKRIEIVEMREFRSCTDLTSAKNLEDILVCIYSYCTLWLLHDTSDGGSLAVFCSASIIERLNTTMTCRNSRSVMMLPKKIVSTRRVCLNM